MTRFFGCHVSVAGGLQKAIENANELNVNTIQCHPSPPQRWNTKPFAEGIEAGFVAAREQSQVKRVFFHGIYLINLANPEPQKLHLSKTSLVEYLNLLARVGGDGVIFHVGSFKDQEDEAAGYKQIINAVNAIIEKSDPKSRLLLEVSAGSGKIIGSRMEALARIFEGVADKKRVGFALDTQHMWASGYDLKGAAEQVVNDIDRILGLENVSAIHLNDSKTDLGSKKDRHENLGQGLIGREALEYLINHVKLRNIPFILETPALKALETAKVEVEVLRSIIRE